MAQNTDAMDAEQDSDELDAGDYVRISDDATTFPGRVAEVTGVKDVDGTTVYGLDVDGAREEHALTADYLDALGEWADYASSRVRSFVADARHSEQIGTPEVVKVGDTGAILSPEFENGTLSGRVFDEADRYGFEVAEVNFNEETVLFQDPALAE